MLLQQSSDIFITFACEVKKKQKPKIHGKKLCTNKTRVRLRTTQQNGNLDHRPAHAALSAIGSGVAVSVELLLHGCHRVCKRMLPRPTLRNHPWNAANVPDIVLVYFNELALLI